MFPQWTLASEWSISCCITCRGEAVTHPTQHSGLGSWNEVCILFIVHRILQLFMYNMIDLELFPHAMNELHTSTLFLSMKWIEYWLLLDESHNFIYKFVIAEIFNKGMRTSIIICINIPNQMVPLFKPLALTFCSRRLFSFYLCFCCGTTC